jgi:hypothetical protein
MGRSTQRLGIARDSYRLIEVDLEVLVYDIFHRSQAWAIHRSSPHPAGWIDGPMLQRPKCPSEGKDMDVIANCMLVQSKKAKQCMT